MDLYLFIFYLFFSSDFDLKIRVAEQYAIVGKPFRVTCLINNAADFKDEIIFFRNGAFLLSFFQHRDSCFPFMNQHEEDYEAMCSDQANDRYRRVKRYIASCRHASMEDATIWACVMLSHNIRSNNLSLGVSSKFLCLFSISRPHWTIWGGVCKNNFPAPSFTATPLPSYFPHISSVQSQIYIWASMDCNSSPKIWRPPYHLITKYFIDTGEEGEGGQTYIIKGPQILLTRGLLSPKSCLPSM